MTLAEDIEAQLSHHGGASAELDSHAWADTWRKTARKVARGLGRPIETVSYRSRGRIAVAASLRDFPRDDAEQERRDEYIHAIMREVWTTTSFSGSPLSLSPET